MEQFYQSILQYWRPAVEIVILWYAIYHMLVFFEGTRARNVLRGIVILLLLYFAVQKAGLHTLDWIMSKIFTISVIGLFIIFQPELRQGLARLGRGSVLFGAPLLKDEELEEIVNRLVLSAFHFSNKKVGILIAIEREDSLKNFYETGVQIDAVLSEELLDSIFGHLSPLHDGGVILVGGRIVAAGCLFPLTEDAHLSRTYGTRHRAALGLTEDTDAVVIIVSEETGRISLAIDGHMVSDFTKEDLKKTLLKFLRHKK